MNEVNQGKNEIQFKILPRSLSYIKLWLIMTRCLLIKGCTRIRWSEKPYKSKKNMRQCSQSNNNSFSCFEIMRKLYLTDMGLQIKTWTRMLMISKWKWVCEKALIRIYKTFSEKWIHQSIRDKEILPRTKVTARTISLKNNLHLIKDTRTWKLRYTIISLPKTHIRVKTNPKQAIQCYLSILKNQLKNKTNLIRKI